MRGLKRRIAIALSVTPAVSGTAFANPAPDLPSITVAVAAEDLANDVGTRGLTKRLQAAARQVCREEASGDDGYLFTHACYVAAMQDALEQLKRLRAGHVVAFTAASIVVGTRR